MTDTAFGMQGKSRGFNSHPGIMSIRIAAEGRMIAKTSTFQFPSGNHEHSNKSKPASPQMIENLFQFPSGNHEHSNKLTKKRQRKKPASRFNSHPGIMSIRIKSLLFPQLRGNWRFNSHPGIMSIRIWIMLLLATGNITFQFPSGNHEHSNGEAIV